MIQIARWIFRHDRDHRRYQALITRRQVAVRLEAALPCVLEAKALLLLGIVHRSG
jgi:hypothetical protein